MTLSSLSLHSVKCIHSMWEITSIHFPVVLLLALGDTPLRAKEEGATSGATLSQLAVYSLYPLRKSLQTYFQSEGNIYTFPQCFPFKDFSNDSTKNCNTISRFPCQVWHVGGMTLLALSTRKYLHNVFLSEDFQVLKLSSHQKTLYMGNSTSLPIH